MKCIYEILTEVVATAVMASVHYVKPEKISEWYKNNLKKTVNDNPELAKGLLLSLRTRHRVEAQTIADLLENDIKAKAL